VLNPQLYVDDVAGHYGINLRGSGQNISVVYDETLGVGKLGVTRQVLVPLGSGLTFQHLLFNSLPVGTFRH
jgi:hypothetical protein